MKVHRQGSCPCKPFREYQLPTLLCASRPFVKVPVNWIVKSILCERTGEVIINGVYGSSTALSVLEILRFL